MATSNNEENIKEMGAEMLSANWYHQQQGLCAKSNPQYVDVQFTAHEHWTLEVRFYLSLDGDSPRADVQKVSDLNLRSNSA